jgi:hypothetical protein
MFTTNLHLTEQLHREHLASIQQAASEARRLRAMEGHNTPDRTARHVARLVVQMSGALALVLAFLR